MNRLRRFIYYLCRKKTGSVKSAAIKGKNREPPNDKKTGTPFKNYLEKSSFKNSRQSVKLAITWSWRYWLWNLSSSSWAFRILMRYLSKFDKANLSSAVNFIPLNSLSRKSLMLVTRPVVLELINLERISCLDCTLQIYMVCQALTEQFDYCTNNCMLIIIIFRRLIFFA
jgi:hypothetical protein